MYICIMGRKRNNKYDSAYQLYLDGMSLEQIGQHLNVSRQCVYKAFKERGLTFRGPNYKPYQLYDGKKFTLRNTGYYALTTDNRCLMHRYVWQKHNGQIPDGWDIHHINEQKADNRIENLECLPKAEHTRRYSPHNNQYGAGRRKVQMIDVNGYVVKTFESTTIAAKALNISRAAICRAINGHSKTCLKHYWKYADN